MSNDYSEDNLIEQTSIDIFKHQLGWKIANVYQGEKFGENGTIGRDSIAEVLLKHRFYKAVKKLNKDLPVQAYQQAFDVINSKDITKALPDINQEKHDFLKDGIPITYKDNEGKIVRLSLLQI